jgi:hypothetical protein
LRSAGAAAALLCFGFVASAVAHASDTDSAAQVLAEARSQPGAKPVRRVVELLKTGQADAITDAALELLAERVSNPAAAAEAREVLELYTRHRRAAARVRAYAALGRSADKSAEAVLTRGLGDASPEVRAACAGALADRHATGSLDALFRALERGVPEAGRAIGRIGDATSVERFERWFGKAPLTAMLEGYEAYLRRPDLGDDVKLSILGKLEEVGSDRVRELVFELAKPGVVPAGPRLSKELARLRRRAEKQAAQAKPGAQP